MRPKCGHDFPPCEAPPSRAHFCRRWTPLSIVRYRFASGWRALLEYFISETEIPVEADAAEYDGPAGGLGLAKGHRERLP